MKHALLLWLLVTSPMLLGQDEAEVTGRPTDLQTVLNSTLTHYPLVLAAAQDVTQQQAQALAAHGAFDPRIDSTVGGRTRGYYSGQQLDAVVLQPLPSMNMRLFSGYRVSTGEFPLYESGDFTRDGGELRLGVAMSLWRNRQIDDRRAKLASSELDVQVATHKLTAEQLKVVRQAYITYARWLLAHRLNDSYTELLQLAVQRGVAIERSIAAGNSAQILLVENQQSIVQRQGLVADAQRQIGVAGEQLALFLRSDSGEPMLPLYSSTLALPAEDVALLTTPVNTLLAQVREKRPELKIVRLAQQQAGIKKMSAENLAKPLVDLSLYSTRDFGQGPVNLAGTDNVVQVSISVPLGKREARGKANAAQAEITGLGYELRLLEDQVLLELRSALVNLHGTRQMENFAAEELTLSQQLTRAEQQRFDAGQSDFFLLNQRERQMAEAQLKHWQANLTHQIALADFYTATMYLLDESKGYNYQ